MSSNKKLFLSAVSSEFVSYRNLLAADLKGPDVDVRVQEDFVVGGGTTLEKLDEYILHCDAVIHLIGKAAGALPEGPAVTKLLAKYPDLGEHLPPLAEDLKKPQPGFSYTQWEAYLALYHGRRLYVYTPADFERDALDVPRDASFVFRPSEAEAQNEHYRRISALGRDRGEFRNAERLSSAVLRSLDEILRAGPEMTWPQLRDICKDITERQMAPVREPYLQRKHVRQQFDTFLANSAQRAFVLLGKSGVGKSSFLLTSIEEVRKTACVLMYHAAHICLSSKSRITDIVSEDFTKRLLRSRQEVQHVWSEIHKMDRIQERQVIFCVDAIDKNERAAQLLTQLNELVLDPWKWLKIVFICRSEAWRSIKSGVGVTLDERFYAEVEMKPFSRQELRQVYAEYQREYHLKTSYDSLSNELREKLRDPFDLWLLAKAANAHDSKAMPETVKASELIDLYVDTLLRREDLWFLEDELVPLMVGIGHYSDVIRGSGLYRTDKALFNKVFSSDGRNQSFLRLVDAEILVRRDLGVEATIEFKHDRFYDHFAGNKIASLSETQVDRYAFFLELIEEVAGKKEATDGTKSTSKPFLWGAVRNALVKEARNANSETTLKLCHTTEGRVKEMMVDVLVTLGVDFRKEVEEILKCLALQEKDASAVQKLGLAMRKATKGSDIAFRNAGRIAIEVASTLGIAWVLQQAALRDDPSLRTEAVRYSYYLWQRDRAAGFDVLEYAAGEGDRWFDP